MGKSEFLKNLVNAVETGDFNSDAAKKINEINSLADKKTPAESEEAIKKRLESAGIKVLSDDDIALNTQFEEKMEEIKKQDEANKVLATLIDIEEMVNASVDDMLSYIDEIQNKYVDELNKENLKYGDLYLKIEEIKSKFNK